ncbi:MAG: caspase family protein [Leptospiraceae bacterium]|nr:caspase family protein [Leptospiraceae bacterium]
MKPFRKSFSFLLLLLALSSYGDDVPVPVTMGLKPIVTGTRIAFLVGINSYKATTSLKYAVGDSEAIEDLLLRTGKYDKLIKLNDYGKITTVLNPETLSYSSQRIKMAPTKANIEATYQEVLAENPDTLLFYYSGHGFIEGEGGENFIAPKDVDVKFEKKKVGKVEKEVPIPLNGISLKVMGVQAAKVKRVVFLIDACRSPLPEAEGEESNQGEKALSSNKKEETNTETDFASKEIQRKQNILSVRTDKLPKRVLEAEGITMLIGAAPEVSSLEDEDFKSGIFTHFLKKAFNGGVQEENQEEYITEENLSRYIEDRFKHYYELRKKESETAAEPKLYNLTFDRGKKGELLLTHHRPIEGKERIDKPIYTDKIRKREVRGKLVYNEKGEREDLRFFVHDKKRDLYYPDSLDGVYKMEYGFIKDKAGELENFTATEFNLENEEVFEYGTKLIPDVGWEYRGLYNASNTATDRMDNDGKDGYRRDDHREDVNRKDLINQVPTVAPVSTMVLAAADKEKIRFEKKIYDFNGNIISEEYFDSAGKLLEFDGVAKIVRAYDKYGQVALEEFYGKDTFDEYGDVTDKGNLVAKEGFARYKAIYKSKGNLLYETWEDVEGKIANTNFGYAKVKYIYDKNDRLIRKKYYDKENKFTNDKWGVSVYSYSYDSNCIGMYESKIAEITKNDNKTALEDWKLGKYKLCLTEEIHTDKDGKPAGDDKMIYKKIRAFSEKGLLISEENFRPENNRRHLENGVAKVEYAHDQEGNIISRKNYGEFEVNKKPVPISDGDGVHEYRYTYQTYFSYEVKPILNECKYYQKNKGILLEPYGCALKIEHFGIDGKPVEDIKGVYRTNIYYTGTYQVEADRHYYSIDNVFLFANIYENIVTDPFNNITMSVQFETMKGKEIPEFKREVKYDEQNNQILKLVYEMNDGKEVFIDKKEYNFDKVNNEILEACYKITANNEVLFSKSETKYDEENHISFRENYELKKGSLVPVNRSEWKYDEKHNLLLFVYFNIEEGQEISLKKRENKYDERNNKTLVLNYEFKDGKEVLVTKEMFEYDARNNKTLEVLYKTLKGTIIPFNKKEYQFDEKNNQILETIYEDIKGTLNPVRKTEWLYDEKKNVILFTRFRIENGVAYPVSKNELKFNERNNKIFEALYNMKEGKEFLVKKAESTFDVAGNLIQFDYYKAKTGKEIENKIKKYKHTYDTRNNEICFEGYDIKEGKEVLSSKYENIYDERNNKILEISYNTKDGNDVLFRKHEYKYDEENNKIFHATYRNEGGSESLLDKKVLEYRLKSYNAEVNTYEPQIKALKERLAKINSNQETRDESEKNTITKNLLNVYKEFEAKKKKYTLTEEKFGENEKLESASYKLLFFNSRGPAEKRLMRVDLDSFYRPVKVGFEVE